MHQRPFQQVDVHRHAYLGNPLAVVLDGEGLSTEAMQQFTNWTNPPRPPSCCRPRPRAAPPGRDYRVRIFCPGREAAPFAGHPTLGSCHAWLVAGGQPRAPGRIVQECGVGLVTLRQDGDRLAFAAPRSQERAAGGRRCGADRTRPGRGAQRHPAPRLVRQRPNWRGVMLRSAEQVLALQPDAAAKLGWTSAWWGPRGKVGVVGASDAEGIAFEVRAFFPGNNGLAEDPVTGSLNAALAQWLIGAGLAPTRYVASQGTAWAAPGACMGAGRRHDLRVGGSSVTCISGEVLL